MSVISVDPRRKLGHLHRYVYGGFIEHLGRCIYGGIYEEGSPLSDMRGFRTDVLDLLKQLRISQLRWPGGNFVSNYHWQDGIGPKDTRPARPEILVGGHRAQPFWDQRVRRVLQSTRGGALYLPEHGLGDAKGSSFLGGVLQFSRSDLLGRAAPG